MPVQVDPKNEAELKTAIARLTKKLRAQAVKYTLAQKLAARLAKQRQTLKAWRATRRRQLEKVKHPGRRAVIQEALKCVGQTEHPAGSNKGPGIVSKCQVALLGYDGVAWCGCFGAWFLKLYGGVKVTARMAYCPSNVTDAHAAQASGQVVNGWAGVRTDKTKGQPGDCAMMDWQRDGIADHFVILVKYLGGGWYETVEGNTSFDDAGSQSNGGCVAHKKRHTSDMAAICVPAYAR